MCVPELLSCTLNGNLSLLQARQLQEAKQEIRSVRAPTVGEGFEHLTPNDDLSFTSKSWSITLDPKTGKISAAAVYLGQPGLIVSEGHSHVTQYFCTV